MIVMCKMYLRVILNLKMNRSGNLLECPYEVYSSNLRRESEIRSSKHVFNINLKTA